MRIAVIFLILPALAYAAPEKRFLMDGIDHRRIRQDLQLIVDIAGSNETEEACEDAVHRIATGLLFHSAQLLCHSFQALVQRFHIVPDPTTTTAAPVKRFVLDTLLSIVNVDIFRHDLQCMVDKLGSDPTEQQCEEYGHSYLTGLLDHSVALICHGFQELVHHFSVVPQGNGTTSCA
ncbi:uncharacterized protein LOC123532221 [Mercenaria mercenaria]|uniref:uncharacterized protein LOC123532221 n=1 Tax=Mercenaria mercenaria TaxID=6596 RepID=UPI00234FB0CE|nr:uncharacterized protein LOC123532221 [Mercenaria mercenaria]